MQQLIYILLTELQMAEKADKILQREPASWAKLSDMWNAEMMPKIDQVFNSHNTDLESFIYGWAICKGASVDDATTFSIQCTHSIEFGD